MISVIIPLYNKENYIVRCIDSILNQTYTDYEIVIVNDASPDNSVQIIRDTYNDERIRIINRPNGGPAAARNTGIMNACGEWIVFLDADDVFLPWALETFIKIEKTNPGNLYYICNYFMGSEDRYSLFTTKTSDMVVHSPFMWEFMNILSDRPGSAMYKVELLRNHLFNENLRRFEDAESQYEILRKVLPYQSSTPVMISFRDASEAAFFRKNISEDFIGHLEFKDKTYWEKMQLYKLLQGGVIGYKEQALSLYTDVLSSK